MVRMGNWVGSSDRVREAMGEVVLFERLGPTFFRLYFRRSLRVWRIYALRGVITLWLSRSRKWVSIGVVLKVLRSFIRF